MPNEDSDLELNREVELINMMGSYVNRNRIPIQINGVYIFPQSNNIHDLRWEEYPDEACSDHSVRPRNTAGWKVPTFSYFFLLFRIMPTFSYFRVKFLLFHIFQFSFKGSIWVVVGC